ncbi:MAG TPA: M6 family metalloprotease domain-containing protein, partial [candidate division Zixibacteria bacterium]|nr:M6 family metalloprotease domain-containing protein [candidate division Zixibacteria bacterium]
MPPHPSLQDKIQTGEAKAPKHNLVISDEELAKAGFNPALLKTMAPSRPKAVGPFNILVILVDFSDRNSQVAPVFFDSLIYAKTQSSVWRYYDENSYGTFDLVTVSYPSSTGWQRAPQTLAYYANGQNGFGTYPQNAQKLVEDAVDLINPLVNFADYDNDGDGYVDGIAVVHSGQGAEMTGNPNDIWSHKWAITPRLRDGVRIFEYSMEPEYYTSPGDMTIGVYCHEFGHAIGGLPDLYDTDGGSWGIGRWSVMAQGSWNGSFGSSPAHFDPWCKIQMGFAVAGVITTNQTGVNIPNVEQSNAGIFRLWTNGAIGPEYFLVENRQRIGYDAALPANSHGLLIWHIDDTVSTNNNRPWYPPNNPSAGHYRVALVQADNLWQLEQNQNSGNSGDPFPGSTVNRNFNASTVPNSDGYGGTGSLVQVTNISNSAGTMTADFSVQVPTDVDDFFNRPKKFQLSQNYPNPFNPATVIAYTLEKSGPVELEIFNLLGEKIKTLVSAHQGAGLHRESWDGTDEKGRSVSSGLYLYRLRLEKSAETKKMTLVR